MILSHPAILNRICTDYRRLNWGEDNKRIINLVTGVIKWLQVSVTIVVNS